MSRGIADWWSRLIGKSSGSRTAELKENPFKLHPGDVLETVLLSALHDGCICIWRANGTSEVRRLEGEGAAVAQFLGRGVIARTSPEPNRYREIGLLNAKEQLLGFPGRMMVKQGASVINTCTQICRATLATPPRPMDASSWAEWGRRWLNPVLLEAASRGEYIVIDKGGWEAGKEPYALLGVFRKQQSANWISIIEAKPAPPAAPWPAGKAGEGATIELPENADTVGVAGVLAAAAVSGWARTPLDVVLTFGTNPSGAWRPEFART